MHLALIMKSKNFSLIGMPGVGKSTIGKKLSEKLKYTFVDLDKKIVEKENKSINELLSLLGNQGLVNLEEAETLRLDKFEKLVISPGGSIIYSKKAMNFLKRRSTIIFLDASLIEIKKRIDNLHERGIVGLEIGIDKLYHERKELYKKYADIIIDTENFDLDKITKDIINSIKGSGKVKP